MGRSISDQVIGLGCLLPVMGPSVRRSRLLLALPGHFLLSALALLRVSRVTGAAARVAGALALV